MSSSSERYDSKGREKIQCEICSKFFHRLDVHLTKAHGINTSEYAKQHPGSPTISDAAKKAAAKGARKRSTAKPAKPAKPGSASTSHAKRVQALKKRSAPEEGVFKIGVARIRQRTDKDLTAQDKKHLPVHDEHYKLGPAEREQWEYLALGVQASENVLIVGPTGCGKSLGVQELAAVCNQPMQRINLHGEVRAAMFVGDKTVEVDPKTNQAVVLWQDGILTDAMRKGHWLLLDELDAAPAHILFVLQAVLEKGMRLVLPTGEVVQAHADFRIIATANTLGRGDDTGLYSGTNILNEAFLDRFGIIIQAGYPTPDTEAGILTERTGINHEDAARMVRVARDVRKALETETVYCTFSTRRLVTWADKAVRLGDVKRAAKIAVTNRLSSEDATFINGIVQRVWG